MGSDRAQPFRTGQSWKPLSARGPGTDQAWRFPLPGPGADGRNRPAPGRTISAVEHRGRGEPYASSQRPGSRGHSGGTVDAIGRCRLHPLDGLRKCCQPAAGALLDATTRARRAGGARSPSNANRPPVADRNPLAGAGGGALGVFLAIWGVRLLLQLTPADLPLFGPIGVNGPSSRSPC